MFRFSHRTQFAFTLLEVTLAIMIAVVVMAVAVPSLTGLMGAAKAPASFQAFDDMAQEAHERSISEGRNYVLVWGRDRKVVLRPEDPSGRAEAEGLLKWKIDRDEKLILDLPAALTAKGLKPDAIWTFWSNGICEPAEVSYEGTAGKWKATYNPFTVQAEVSYE